MQRIFGINRKPSTIVDTSSVKCQPPTEVPVSCDEELLVWSPEKLASEAVTDSPEYCYYMSESYDRLKQVLAIIENLNKIRQRMGQLLSEFVGNNDNLLSELRELEKFINPDAQALLNNSIETFDSVKNVFEVLSQALNHTEIISDRADIKKKMQACQADLKTHTSKVYRRISRKMLKSSKGNPSAIIDAEVGIDGDDKTGDGDDSRKKLVEKNLALAAKEFQIEAFLNEDLILGVNALKNPFSVFFKMGSFNFNTSSKEDVSRLMEKIRGSRSANKEAFEQFAKVFSENYLAKNDRNLRKNCTIEGIAVHHQKIFSKRVFLQYNSSSNILTRTNMENLKDVTENLVSKVDRLFNDNIEVTNGFDVITNKDNILTFTVYDEEERDRWLSSFGKNLAVPTVSLPAKKLFEYNERFLIVALMCVESCASTVTGIYRISTTIHEVNMIMSRISTMEGNVFVVDKFSAHAYSGCVKKWLEILDFIISADQYDRYFRALESKVSDTVSDHLLKQPFIDLINELNPEKKNALKLLCQHLKRVNKDEEVNKMTTRNLAACLMPRIFQFDQEKMFNKFHFIITLCSYLISNFETIFNCDLDMPYEGQFTFLVRNHKMPQADVNKMVEKYEKVTFLCDIFPDEDFGTSLTVPADEECSGGVVTAERRLSVPNRLSGPTAKMRKLYTSMIMKSKTGSTDSVKN